MNLEQLLGGGFLGIGVLAMGTCDSLAVVRYVDANGSNPTAPYTNWSTAATTIQDAVDAAGNGDTVLVTNGVYGAGGKQWFDSGTNRVTVTNSLVLQSVNGPAVTVIEGARGSGASAVRCVLLTTNALLSGFTLTNGQSGIGNYPSGGGLYCYSTNAMASNCVLAGNLANELGGGAYRGTLINCILKDNVAGTGVSAGCGGGAHSAVLYNCTLTGNTAGRGGGAAFGTVYNCILYFNANKPGGSAPNYVSEVLNYCCTTPLPDGVGNITNDPGLVNPGAGDLHLQSNSPCINAGRNLYVASSTDFDGAPRIAGGTVDLGAYEFPSPLSRLSYAWARQYGLPVNGSGDSADTDGDGMNNWQEWIAGTNPTDASSVLQMLPPADGTPGLTVRWQSVTNRTYYLERSGKVGEGPGFSALQSNIVGQAGTTAYTDTTVTNGGPFFYRVGVQQ